MTLEGEAAHLAEAVEADDSPLPSSCPEGQVVEFS